MNILDRDREVHVSQNGKEELLTEEAGAAPVHSCPKPSFCPWPASLNVRAYNWLERLTILIKPLIE